MGTALSDTIDVIFDNALATDSAEWAWVVEQLPTESFRAVLSARRMILKWPRPISREGQGRKFIAVGHSVGGLFSRWRAAANPEACLGLVLVDASSSEQFSEASATFGQILWLRQAMATRAARVLAGRRDASLDDWMQGTENLPLRAQRCIRRSLNDPKLWMAAYSDLTWAIRHGTSIPKPPSNAPVHRLVASKTATASPEYVDFEVESEDSKVVPDSDHVSITMDKQHASVTAEAIRSLGAKELR